MMDAKQASEIAKTNRARASAEELAAIQGRIKEVAERGWFSSYPKIEYPENVTALQKLGFNVEWVVGAYKISW